MKAIFANILAMGLMMSGVAVTAGPTDGLVLHYTFDGDAIDQTGNMYDGTVMGATLTSDRFGNADSAYRLDGDDYIVTDATGLPESERTISLWMLASGDLGSRPVAVGYGKGCGTTWIMYVTEVAFRLITHCGGTPRITYTYSCAPKDVWTHFAIRIDDSASTIYVNGIEAASTPGLIPTDANGTEFAIGVATHVSTGTAPYTDPNVGFFEGSIDDVRVYNRALSNLEIEQLAAGIGDQDSDGVTDDADNCIEATNPTQLDSDEDGIGNACDGDIFLPNDCQVNFQDLGAMKDAFFSQPGNPNWNPDADLSGDDAVNFQDLGAMKSIFFLTPGPSGDVNICSCVT